MARSFRLTPPPLDAMVERPRLLQSLRQRFDVAVTTIVAGAGFGKSVLLAQAMRDNDVAPRGTDVWLSCDAGESLMTNLLGGLATAADLDPGRAPTVNAFLTSVAERWSMGVCMILDDIHLVADGSAGAKALTEMVADAPPGVSFVLASRSPIAGLARLKAQGRLVELREADLAYRADEVAQLGPEVTADLGGWPALVSLTASFGVGAAREFVAEELLSTIAPPLRRAVATLALIGGADPELAAIANGAPIDVESLLRLPMVTTDGIHIVPHALWGELLADELDPSEADAILRVVGSELLERGDEIRAGSMFIAAGDSDGLRRAIRATCAQGYATVSTDVLAWWWSALDRADRASCEAKLLDALVRRSAEPYSDQTQTALAAAVVSARAAGDVRLEVAALWEFGFVTRARGDINAMVAEMPRVLALESQGEHVAAPLAAIARAMASDVMGDHVRAAKELALIDRGTVPPGWLAPIAFIRMVFAFYDGDLDGIGVEAAAFLEYAPDDFPGREFVEPWVQWLRGVVPANWESLPTPGSAPGSTDADRLWTGSATGVMLANANLSERAEIAVGIATEAGRGTLLPHLQAMVAAGHAALLVSRGKEDEARVILRAELGTDPLAFVARERALSAALAIGYVLVPEHREHWDQHELGPLHESIRTLARGVAAVRADRPPSGLDDAAVGSQITTALPLAWAVELVCAHVADDAVRAREMMERLVEAHGERTRVALRIAAESETKRVARGAAGLLASVPVGSVEVEVRLLGPAQLIVESRLVDGPDWRRSRVRALLCLLALRRQVRREEAMLLLWPDLADAPARHNLRVTLNYLQGLLEPERRGGEAPFYLRQDAEWLRLLDEPHVVVDADVFERGIARGDRLRAEGRLVLAIAAYDDAFALWRGGCLADVVNEDWAQPSIARITNRAANARLASGSIRMALDDVPGAIDAAIGALEIDQWSEPAYRLTVAAHLARADRPAAHRAMKECRAMLNDLGVAPSDETLALERRLAGPQR